MNATGLRIESGLVQVNFCASDKMPGGCKPWFQKTHFPLADSKQKRHHSSIRMNDDATLDAIFTALAHPARRRMLGLVVGNGRSVTELAGEFDSSLNVVSKHIKVLESAGLVQREKTGRVHQIRLEPKPLRKAAAFIERYEKIWERKLDTLSGHLDRMAAQEAKSRTLPKRS